MKSNICAYIIIVMGVCYCHTETKFFGSHWLPSCPEEVIADGIAGLMVCIGFAVLALGGVKR